MTDRLNIYRPIPEPDAEARCLLGNGECPRTCRLQPVAEDLTRKFGIRFMRTQSRQKIIFGEGLDERMDLARTATIMTLCEKEQHPVE